jgi:YggT family protein
MRLLALLIDLYSIVVLLAVVMSWFQQGRRNPLATFVHSLTEPALEPIRRVLPAVGGLDFSPMVLLIVLRVLRSFV